VWTLRQGLNGGYFVHWHDILNCREAIEDIEAVELLPAGAVAAHWIGPRDVKPATLDPGDGGRGGAEINFQLTAALKFRLKASADKSGLSINAKLLRIAAACLQWETARQEAAELYDCLLTLKQDTYRDIRVLIAKKLHIDIEAANAELDAQITRKTWAAIDKADTAARKIDQQREAERILSDINKRIYLAVHRYHDISHQVDVLAASHDLPDQSFGWDGNTNISRDADKKALIAEQAAEIAAEKRLYARKSQLTNSAPDDEPQRKPDDGNDDDNPSHDLMTDYLDLQAGRIITGDDGIDAVRAKQWQDRLFDNRPPAEGRRLQLTAEERARYEATANKVEPERQTREAP
jgi:hypothetical protein